MHELSIQDEERSILLQLVVDHYVSYCSRRWGEISFAPSKVVESEIQEHQEVCQFEYCFAHPSVVFHGEPQHQQRPCGGVAQQHRKQ